MATKKTATKAAPVKRAAVAVARKTAPRQIAAPVKRGAPVKHVAAPVKQVVPPPKQVVAAKHAKPAPVAAAGLSAGLSIP